ncbi:hypothetical protein ABK040_005541 [Willaertia magna]
MSEISEEKTKILFFHDEFMKGLWKRPDPLLTVDYHPYINRVVTAGIQTDIKIWEINSDDEFQLIAKMDPIYDTAKIVNVARWSPCGNYIATGCGRGAILIWKKKCNLDNVNNNNSISLSSSNQPSGNDKDKMDIETSLKDQSEMKPTEEWMIFRKFGGEEGEDVWDLNWSPPLIDQKTGKTCFLLAVTTMDRKLKVYQPLDNVEILFEYTSDNFSSIGGCSWDPNGCLLAVQLSVAKKVILFSLNNERYTLMTPSSTTDENVTLQKKKKRNSPLLEKISTIKKNGKDNKDLFQGDNYTIQYRSTVLNSIRRLNFSPDGMFLIATAGQGNSAFMFSRKNWKIPVKCINGFTSTSPITKFSSVLYKSTVDNPLLPYKMVACASSKDEIIVFDTESETPLFRSQRLFAQSISDISWSNDGNSLFVTSQEGYMAIIKFEEGTFGERYDLSQNVKPLSPTLSPTEIHLALLNECKTQTKRLLQNLTNQNSDKNATTTQEEVNILIPKKKKVNTEN